MKSLRLRISQIIESADIFGVPLQLTIQSNSKAYQSVYGGLTTVFICVFSGYYLLYLLVQWQTKTLLPQVNTQTLSNEFDELIIQRSIFTLSLGIDQYSDKLRYYNTTKRLFDQTINVQTNYNVNHKGIPNPDDYSCGVVTDYLFFPLCQNIHQKNQLHLMQSKNDSLNTYFQYFLKPCNPNKNDNCINLENVTDTGVVYWTLTLFKQDTDFTTGGLLAYSSNLYYNLDSRQSLYIQLKVVKATVVIDYGFLWPSETVTDIVKDVIVISSLSARVDSDFYINIEISLEKNSQVIFMTYPKVTQILAWAGSCFQTLLMMGFFLNVWNSKHMDSFINDRLLKMYFPQFSRLFFKRNFMGKIIDVETTEVRDGQITQKQKTLLIQNRRLIIDQLQNKMGLLDILNDINKLQLAFQSFIPRSDSIQKLNYQLSFFQGGMDREQQNLSHRLIDERDFFRFFLVNEPTASGSQQSNRIHSDPIQSDPYDTDERCLPNNILFRQYITNPGRSMHRPQDSDEQF